CVRAANVWELQRSVALNAPSTRAASLRLEWIIVGVIEGVPALIANQVAVQAGGAFVGANLVGPTRAIQRIGRKDTRLQQAGLRLYAIAPNLVHQEPDTVRHGSLPDFACSVWVQDMGSQSQL